MPHAQEIPAGITKCARQTRKRPRDTCRVLASPGSKDTELVGRVAHLREEKART
eukprot:CAMPEP_0194520678 /NCGR_PEP_ID=MMETSP0253-20130528/54769_1 /TAXON_ID=2966 /ORGANISM="Noctiluca scintillans" /LENGTH=53 /DNA_ID=CAMNT_0039364949 /DNA_START=213 /DNA_END=371 /DNA_ORIENTATION=+